MSIRVRRPIVIALACVVTALWLAPRAAHAVWFESWGNDPIAAVHLGNWADIAPLINHRSRVYHVVGGVANYRRLYYRGDADALNAGLRAFVKLGGEKLVVIRPGPAEVLSFEKKPVAFDWSLELPAGPTDRKFSEKHRQIDSSRWPTLTIRPGANVELDGIEVPPGVTVLHTADLLEHYRKRLKDGDKRTRLRAAMKLSQIDPYAEQDARAMADMLNPNEKDRQYIWHTADSLARYGVRARFALPALRDLLNHGHEHVRERASQAIDLIESAKEDAEAEEMHRVLEKRIEQFVKELKREEP